MNWPGRDRHERVSALVVVALLGASCTHPVAIQRVQAAIRSVNCGDGLPAKILIDVRCPDGVCGYTCVPARWDDAKR
jgi:hypothetical protein